MDIKQELEIDDLSICVVEPSPVQGRIIENHLRDMGVREARVYQSAVKALDEMHVTQPDLVISAMYMPEMTGTELVHTMRTRPKLETIPFMLVSSETSFSALDPIRQAGVVAILPKPFQPHDLKVALTTTIEHIQPDEAALDDHVLDDLEVLVVDDSSMARKHICRILRQMGIENITEAEDGTDAVVIIEQNFFDLVVTDYNMPDMDGDKLIKYIREHSNQRAIPVLMVTSEDDESRLAAVQQAGVSGICDKPFRPSHIKHLITTLLQDNA